jgi:hypothetical protein
MGAGTGAGIPFVKQMKRKKTGDQANTGAFQIQIEMEMKSIQWILENQIKDKTEKSGEFR